jgi:hypothetical protein
MNFFANLTNSTLPASEHLDDIARRSLSPIKQDPLGVVKVG